MSSTNVSLDVAKHFYAFCRGRNQNHRFDEVIREEFNRVKLGSRRRSELMSIVRAVWAVNAACGNATQSLFDAALWAGANVLPLLRTCRDHETLRVGVVDGGVCRVTGEKNTPNMLQISVADKVWCVREDVGTIIKYFHTLIWYVDKMSALDAIDEQKEHFNLNIMINSINDTLVSSSRVAAQRHVEPASTTSEVRFCTEKVSAVKHS